MKTKYLLPFLILLSTLLISSPNSPTSYSGCLSLTINRSSPLTSCRSALYARTNDFGSSLRISTAGVSSEVIMGTAENGGYSYKCPA